MFSSPTQKNKVINFVIKKKKNNVKNSSAVPSMVYCSKVPFQNNGLYRIIPILKLVKAV